MFPKDKDLFQEYVYQPFFNADYPNLKKYLMSLPVYKQEFEKPEVDSKQTDFLAQVQEVGLTLILAWNKNSSLREYDRKLTETEHGTRPHEQQ